MMGPLPLTWFRELNTPVSTAISFAQREPCRMAFRQNRSSWEAGVLREPQCPNLGSCKGGNRCDLLHIHHVLQQHVHYCFPPRYTGS